MRQEDIERHAAQLMSNGLSSSATLFMPAAHCLAIMRDAGEVPPDVAEYLTALDMHPVMIKDGTVVAVTFDEEGNPHDENPTHDPP